MVLCRGVASHDDGPSPSLSVSLCDCCFHFPSRLAFSFQPRRSQKEYLDQRGYSRVTVSSAHAALFPSRGICLIPPNGQHSLFDTPHVLACLLQIKSQCFSSLRDRLQRTYIFSKLFSNTISLCISARPWVSFYLV